MTRCCVFEKIIAVDQNVLNTDTFLGDFNFNVLQPKPIITEQSLLSDKFPCKASTEVHNGKRFTQNI